MSNEERSAGGRNLLLTLPESRRAEIEALFVEVIGSTPASPTPAIRTYALGDGFSVGVVYVDGDPLGDRWRQAPWLEFRVADVDAVRNELRARGVEDVSHEDVAHSYHRLPGGPVFRIAAL